MSFEKCSKTILGPTLIIFSLVAIFVNLAAADSRSESPDTSNCPKKYKAVEEILKEPLYERAAHLCDFLSTKLTPHLGEAADDCAKMVRKWKQVKQVEVFKDRNPIVVRITYDPKSLSPADAPDFPPDKLEALFLPEEIPVSAMRYLPAYCK